MVTWFNTNEGDFPTHGQRVIIDIGGSFQLARFNYLNKEFVVIADVEPKYSAKKQNIKWTDFKI
jgi:hypothetical protein